MERIIQDCARGVINNYQDCSGDASTIKIIAGEAYFLRAFAYYTLVRLWGDIPMVTASGYNSDDASIGLSS